MQLHTSVGTTIVIHQHNSMNAQMAMALCCQLPMITIALCRLMHEHTRKGLLMQAYLCQADAGPVHLSERPSASGLGFKGSTLDTAGW